MPRKMRWVELLPGVIAVAAVLAVALSILFFARIGALHGDTVHLYVATSQARGVIEGTEVWLAGQKVGLVDEIRFRPVTTDTTGRLVLQLEILKDYHPLIRRDSYAQIRSGGTLLGAQIISIEAGSTQAPMIEAGDTIPSKPQGDTEGVASQIAVASRQFPAIISNVKLINQQLGAAMAAVGLDRQGARIDALRGSALELTREATSGQGTIGLALRGDLAGRASRAMAGADSVRALLASPEGALGRFRRDSTLLRTVADIRYEVSVARRLITEARGSAGRAVADEAITRELAQLEAELGELMADIKRQPLRYISF